MISLALYTGYSPKRKEWMLPSVWRSMSDFRDFLKKEGYLEESINIHEIPNTRYEIEED